MIVLSVSPIAFSIFSLNVYWYGIIYATALSSSWAIATHLLKQLRANNITVPSKAEFDSFMFWAIVTIIVSARFGHILFFEPTYYLKHPFEVLMIRNGGLSFHGSVIGLGIYSYFFIRSKKVQWLLMADVLSIAGALGVGIGRIANFINQELYGKVTSSNYSVVFATVDKFQRHPTQIFESFFEGFLNFWTLFLILKFRGIRTFGSGVFVSVFCIIYSSSRFAIEFLKEVEAYNYFNVVQLTVGQVLSIIMFVFGISIKKMKYLTKKLIQRT